MAVQQQKINNLAQELAELKDKFNEDKVELKACLKELKLEKSKVRLRLSGVSLKED